MARFAAALSCLLVTLPGLCHGGEQLSARQSDIFRQWFVRIIAEQLRQGPTPRWQQRDCAGLVRFAVQEAVKEHDGPWLRANGIQRQGLPPELNLSLQERLHFGTWKQPGAGEPSAYASAIAIIQQNSRFISRDINQALAGDLLFFDQGQDQHLMVWMGSYLAYHTGRASEKDTGLRKVALHELMIWKDTRWQPQIDNPNFGGVYRFSFLSP